METVGPYRIVKELGRGAMGVVFEAFDPGIGRTVALKVTRYQPLATAAEDAQLKLRFARECSAAGRLSHPNIVTIYHRGEHDGMQYLVMEYVTGASLEALLAPAVPLSRGTSMGIMTQIAAALDYAHAEGVVHRDIKPANILVKPDGAVKLTDFGIARITSQTVTQTGVTMGTPAYMAPEQILAKRVDGRADQFSLAVVAYQMLSGERPFEAPTDQALMFKIVSGEPRSLDEANPLLPRAAAEVVSRGLSKDPERRYRNCSEFVADLRTALGPPAPAAVVWPPQSASAPEPPTAITRRPRRGPLIAACALLAVAAAAWFGYSIYRGKKVNPKDELKVAKVEAPTKSPVLTTDQPAGRAEASPNDESRVTEVEAPTKPPVLSTDEPAGGAKGNPQVGPKAVLVDSVPRPPVTTKGNSKSGLEVAPVNPAPKSPVLPPGPPPGSTKVNPKDGLTYVRIAPGTFTMGCSPGDAECYDDEKPAHQVTIANGFWMGQTPVTQEAYERVVGSNPSHFKGAKLPVETVSWTDASSYCKKVEMRLPTEAEYEYAARGGTTGGRYGDLDQIAWYGNSSGGTTHPVGLKQANAFGLFDMLGNVWEWVADWFARYPAGSQRDPGGPAPTQYRVLRGGSWYNASGSARASLRKWVGPEVRSSGFGLRCAGNSL